MMKDFALKSPLVFSDECKDEFKKAMMDKDLSVILDLDEKEFKNWISDLIQSLGKMYTKRLDSIALYLYVQEFNASLGSINYRCIIDGMAYKCTGMNTKEVFYEDNGESHSVKMDDCEVRISNE